MFIVFSVLLNGENRRRSLELAADIVGHSQRKIDDGTDVVRQRKEEIGVTEVDDFPQHWTYDRFALMCFVIPERVLFSYGQR